MNEIDFRNWLKENGMRSKMQTDCISRLKRIERELDQIDLDEQYLIDKCTYVSSLFDKRGENERMKKFPNVNLPIGKEYISTYKHAIKRYVEFSDSLAEGK